VRAAKEQSGGVARAAAIDGGEWAGAGSAPVADGARLQATPRRDRGASAAPARGGSAFAAVVSLVIHAAIVAAAALSLGAPQPTGAPDAIAVELVASTGEAPTPAPERESTRAAPALHDDATAPAPAGANDATPVSTSAPEATAPQPTDASDAMTPETAKTPETAVAATPNADAAAIPAPPESADAAGATDVAPPSPPPSPGAARAVVAPAPPAPRPQRTAVAPEADFAAAIATPRAEPRRLPTTARAAARLEPAARPSGARAAASAASPPAPARGAAELAAYRSALLAKIWGAARYPEAARERGATGVTTVRFALDGLGAVTLADLAQSSGDRALDDEALAAVRRASPLPPPPAGAPRAYSAPIRFELR
jgi:protein TonB